MKTQRLPRPVFVRDADGRYKLSRPATESELLTQAAAILESRVRDAPLEKPRDAADFLRMKLAPLKREAFACIFLDTRHRVIEFKALFKGTIDATTVHPREVVKAALQLNAAAVILAHNHPSGVPEPSEADRLLTRRLRDALALVDIRIVDHIVVATEGTYSFAERGLL